jgi:hypothetical protein
MSGYDVIYCSTMEVTLAMQRVLKEIALDA